MNDAIINKGNELYKQKNYEASQQEYKKALATDPKDATASYNNGNAQFRATKSDEAIESYNQEIKLVENESDENVPLYIFSSNRSAAFIQDKDFSTVDMKMQKNH